MGPRARARSADRTVRVVGSAACSATLGFRGSHPLSDATGGTKWSRGGAQASIPKRPPLLSRKPYQARSFPASPWGASFRANRSPPGALRRGPALGWFWDTQMYNTLVHFVSHRPLQKMTFFDDGLVLSSARSFQRHAFIGQDRPMLLYGVSSAIKILPCSGSCLSKPTRQEPVGNPTQDVERQKRK